MPAENRNTDCSVEAPFDIPGGWEQRCISIGGVDYTLTVPADADALLDVVDSPANQQTDDDR